MTSVKTITAIACCLLIGMIPEVANAKFLVHATRKAFAPKIMKNGLSTYKMKPNARLGRKEYFANDLRTALKEKPKANAAILFRKSRTFNNRILDTTHMNTNKLRNISGLKDMRGTVKHRVLGPKIGHRIGRYADRNNMVVKYKSARYTDGINYAVPTKLNKIVRPARPLNFN
jgi:hypothetical protein